MDECIKRQTALLKTMSEHLFTQGRLSVGPGGQCLYRGPDGLKCAVGAIIPDSAYEPVIEGCTVAGLMLYEVEGGDYLTPTQRSRRRALRSALLAAGALPEDDKFLRAVQKAHDDGLCDGFNWDKAVRPRLLDVARKFHLDAGVIPE